MKIIPLSRGLFTVVDDADFDELSEHKWYALRSLNTFYAARNTPGETRGQRIVLMHRQLLGCKQKVDHRNGNGLDNRRQNLRPATHAQNLQARQHKKVGATSKYRGVCKHREKWTAQIVVKGRLKYLGRFEDELQAALAYDVAAREYFGEFAAPNFTVFTVGRP